MALPTAKPNFLSLNRNHFGPDARTGARTDAHTSIFGAPLHNKPFRQWFLMFWKPEHLLFRLKTTVLHNTNFLVEQNTVLYKNVAILWEFARINIWDLEQTWVKRHQSRINNQNCKIVITDVAKNNIKFVRAKFEQHRTTRIFNGPMQIIYLQTTPLTPVRDANTGFSTVFMCMGGTIARLFRSSCKFQIVWTIPSLDNLFWLHFQFWLFRYEKSENV